MSTSFGRLFVLPSNDEDALSRMKIVRISAVRKWNIARSNEQRRVKFFFALFALPRKRKKRTSLSVPLNIHSQWTVAMHYKYFNYVLLWRRRVKEEEQRGRGFAAFYDFIASARKFISSLVPVPFLLPPVSILGGWADFFFSFFIIVEEPRASVPTNTLWSYCVFSVLLLRFQFSPIFVAAISLPCSHCRPNFYSKRHKVSWKKLRRNIKNSKWYTILNAIK